MCNLPSILLAILPLVFASLPHSVDNAVLSQHTYRSTHSYGDGYEFNPQSGWQSVSVSDLPYKYQTSSATTGTPYNVSETLPSKSASETQGRRKHHKRKSDKTCKTPNAQALPDKKDVPESAGSIVKNTWDSLKGLGKQQDVTITWYTGTDLQNPSCWPNTDWAPSDESFACALTLEGWVERPSCFKFLELCNGPYACIFVRVVDTCAGCKKGSKHVDLTKAAFSKLAPLDDGKLTVQMRLATDPNFWDIGLWGPKA